jgi:cell division protein FtsL
MVSRNLLWGLLLLGLALVLSGVGVVYSKYLSRKYFVELQGLRAERDRTDIRWGQLQLEESTMASYSRVEVRARDELDMRVPRPDEVLVLRVP